jgi:hypothetical protein
LPVPPIRFWDPGAPFILSRFFDPIPDKKVEIAEKFFYNQILEVTNFLRGVTEWRLPMISKKRKNCALQAKTAPPWPPWNPSVWSASQNRN